MNISYPADESKFFLIAFPQSFIFRKQDFPTTKEVVA